jgi:hypothetical protein
VRGELAALLGGAAGAKAYAAAYFERHGSVPGAPLHKRAAAAEMLALVDPSAKAKASAALLAGGPAGAGEGALRQLLAAAAAPGRKQPAPAGAGAGGAHGEAVEVEGLLARGGPLADAAAAARWRELCAAAFPYSTHFGGPKRWVVPAAGANGVAEGVAKLGVA